MPSPIMVSHPSTPQHRTAPRSLWPSPAFSDYFSGQDDNSPTLVDGAKVTPLQQRILFRLNQIGQQVLRADPSDQTPSILDAELDHIQQMLNAPESQSRAPAEMADSGLFIDDDVEDDIEEECIAEEDNVFEQNAFNLREGREIVARVSKVTELLKERYEELKHINELATSRLQSAADEIIGLRSENEHFHRDLSDIYNSMLALKMQFSELEVQAAPHMSLESGKALREDMRRWKMDWKDVDLRLKSRRHLYEHTLPETPKGMDTGFGNGMSSSMHSSVDLSPPVYRSKLNIRRPGLISKSDSDPFIDQETKENSVNHDAKETSVRPDSKVLQGNGIGIVATKDPEETANEDDNAILSSDEEDEEDEEVKEEPPSKTPWQEFWDSLTEYAGILDYD